MQNRSFFRQTSGPIRPPLQNPLTDSVDRGTPSVIWPRLTDPGKAVRCARALIDAAGPLGIQLRAGLHTGEVELRGPDVGGIAAP
jgi:class 3 adenylate cyclase